MYSYNPYYEKYLAHYGVKRKSGRYPWGSGKRPYQNTANKSGKMKNIYSQNIKEFADDKSYSIPPDENYFYAKKKVHNSEVIAELDPYWIGNQNMSSKEYKKYVDNIVKNYDTINKKFSKQAADFLVDKGYINDKTKEELQKELYIQEPVDIDVSPDKLARICYDHDIFSYSNYIVMSFSGDNYTSDGNVYIRKKEY